MAQPDPSMIPVLISVPHAGRHYPDSLLERMRHPGFAAIRLEDRYVDKLAEEVAAATGASLLVANAPRAMLDLNRSADDVDWDMVLRSPEMKVSERRETGGRRARSGLGLIPRRLPGLGEIWKRRHDHSELEAMVAGIHTPYHEALHRGLDTLRRRWGTALLLDLHSMPPLALGDGPRAEFVIGDRFGSSCCGTVTAAAFSWFAQQRRLAAHNRPYAGGYVLERHSRARNGVHGLQLEIDRSSYLDSHLVEQGDGFADMVEFLVGLVRQLGAHVAQLGSAGSGEWAQAAE
jgi:N-formylglutamate amidohydrolase